MTSRICIASPVLGHERAATRMRHVVNAALVLVATFAAPAFADYVIAPTGGDITGAQLSAQLAGGDVTLAAASGDIVVNDAVAWNAATTLTLNAPGSIRLRAPLDVRHAGGGLALNYGGTAGDPGVTPPAGTDYLVDAPVDFGEEPGGHFSVNGNAYTLLRDVDALQAMRDDLAGRYALARDVDARATRGWNDGAGFEPIGVSSFLGTPFSGTLAGLGHVVRGLFVDRPDAVQGGGLFGGIGSDAGGASVVDLGLRDVDVTGTGAGGLVGYARNSRIDSVWVSGRVAGSGLGGLAASIDGSSVRRSWAQVQVEAQGGGTAGGLVSYAAGSSIAQSWAGGSVTVEAGDAGVSVGGLVGSAYQSMVGHSYATASVSVSGNGTLDAGGLVGRDAGSVSQCWASGRVSTSGGAPLHAGGLVGFVDFSQSAADSYWDSDSTGQANGVGGTNFGTVSNVLAISSQSGTAYAQGAHALFDFASAWYLIEGQTRPFLRSEYSTLVRNAHQLQLMALDHGARYVLGAPVDAAETGRNDGSAANAGGIWTRAGFAPIGFGGDDPFRGVLDGRGHVVGGLTVRRADDGQHVGGLFGWVSGAGISDFGLDRADVASSFVAGGLAARIDTGTRVARAYVSGTVVAKGIGSGQPAYSGGLVGLVYDSEIADSYAAANVATSGVYGVAALGGLVSAASNAGIRRSYAIGHVEVGTGVTHLAGGLVGSDQAGSYAGTFWDSDVNDGLPGIANDPAAPGVTGLSTPHWLTQGPVATAAWDVDDTWVPGYPYPVLKALPHVVVVAQGVSIVPGSATPGVGSYAATDQDGADASALVSGTPTWFVDPAAPADPLPNVGGSGVQAAAGHQLTYASTRLALALAQAAPDYVHYGETVDYVVTLTNGGAYPARGFDVHAVFGGGADVGATTWQCIAGSVAASCTIAGNGPIDDSVTVPPGVSMTWLVHVPVSTATAAGTLDFTFDAAALQALHDSATIVLFRDGFDGAGQ